MTYDEIAKQTETLNYRDKFRLAQTLIQVARKEEEEHDPNQHQVPLVAPTDLVRYVEERLLKMKPAKIRSLMNTIGAMFQYRGGISDADKNHIIAELQKQSRISIDQKGRVSYPSAELA